MNYLYVGKIVSTHGIKGEVKIISNFSLKEKIFVKDFNFYIGTNHIKEVVKTYRKHKQYDMVTFEGYNNINQVLKYMKNNVYVLREDLNLSSDDILESDLIGLNAYHNEEFLGVVNDIYVTGKNYKVIEIINKGTKKTLIPYHKDFIEKIDISNKMISFKGDIFND